MSQSRFWQRDRWWNNMMKDQYTLITNIAGDLGVLLSQMISSLIPVKTYIWWHSRYLQIRGFWIGGDQEEGGGGGYQGGRGVGELWEQPTCCEIGQGGGEGDLLWWERISRDANPVREERGWRGGQWDEGANKKHRFSWIDQSERLIFLDQQIRNSVKNGEGCQTNQCELRRRFRRINSGSTASSLQIPLKN